MNESLNIELRYGTKKHTKILSGLNARKTMSEDKMAELYPEFEEAEEQFLAYLPETEADRLRKEKRRQGEVQYTTVDVPYSYATMLTAHTYWTSVFLSRSPILQFTGRHGETQQSVQSLEALMDYQVQVGRAVAPWYVWLHDTPKYGFGVIYPYWDEEITQVSRVVEVPQKVFGIEIGKVKKEKQTVKIPKFQGNKVLNVRPYDYLPDTRVPLATPEAGEFCGRKVKLNWNSLVRGRANKRYFNLEIVERMGRDQSAFDEEWGSDQLEHVSTESIPSSDIKDIGMKEGYEMKVDLIPYDWGLGESRTPEKWSFTVIDDRVIIEARPDGAYHGQFGYIVLPHEVDGYSLDYRGMLEILKPLNDTMSWLFNTHFFNVRASLNNQFIFDPMRVVVKDLTRPGAGKLIRLKEAAYGTDVRSAITQLPVQDVTSNHLKDTQIVGDLIQRASGVADNIMGMVNPGGRKTATEIRTSSSFGVNRLKTMAEYWSACGWAPMSQIFVQNTQQYYDGEEKFKIAGDLLEEDQRIVVTPDQISGFYDFVPVDGTMPVDRYAQANLWKEILMGMVKVPALAQGYDVPGIFSWMAQLAGLKNIKQFRVNVVPDEQLAQQRQAGNVVPMSAAQPDLERTGEPGQIPGMGTTG